METFIFGVMVSSALLTTNNSPESRYSIRCLSEATYIQTGVDKIVEPVAKNIEKRYVPKNLRSIGVGGLFMYRLVEDRRVEYVWSF